MAAAAVFIAGCSTQNEVMPYPDMTSSVRPPTPSAAMTREEKDAAISELRAEALANAERGL